MFKQLRYKLLAVLLGFTAAIFVITILNNQYEKKKIQIEKIHQSTQDIHSIFLTDAEAINNFLLYDVKNPQFFQTGKSKYLHQHDSILSNLIHCTNLLLNNELLNDKNHLNVINYELSTYSYYIEEIKDLILKRGFKDDGTEGEMRNYIHKLEDVKGINLTNVLMLRRHEKDYIIRNEQKYINKLFILGNEFKKEISVSDNLSKNQKVNSIYYLDQYMNLFDELVSLDSKIGNKNNSGLIKKIYHQKDKIKNLFAQLNAESSRNKNILFRRLQTIYISLMLAIILFSLYFSFYISKRITYPVTLLSHNIADFVSNNFSPKFGDNFPISKRNDEIWNLIDDYKQLRLETISLISDFQTKVEQRTNAITCQKNKIEQQKEEIEAQRDHLYKQKILIEEQQIKTEQQNKDILGSINYAKFIQEALLPSQKTIKKVFPDSFVLFKPKDIVSGDFYWIKRIANKEYDVSLAAVVDCTGHGVPGAFMSILGIALLNEIVYKKEVNQSNHLLNHLQKKVLENLQDSRNGKTTFDGMDIALFFVNHKTNELFFSGANRPLYLIRSSKLEIFKGDNFPIGKHSLSINGFNYNKIKIEKNDQVYIFSDGFADQFGGPNSKKMKRKRFQQLIYDNHTKPMNEIKDSLEDALSIWKGKNPQTDDILIMGIRF